MGKYECSNWEKEERRIKSDLRQIQQCNENDLICGHIQIHFEWGQSSSANETMITIEGMEDAVALMEIQFSSMILFDV